MYVYIELQRNGYQKSIFLFIHFISNQDYVVNALLYLVHMFARTANV